MAQPFFSERLFYRLIDPDQDLPFFQKLQADPVALRNSNPRLARPASKKDAEDYMVGVSNGLLGVIICLPACPSPDADAPNLHPTPIGAIHLSPLSAKLAHHRYTTIGISIHGDYQGQGYGSEAIRWVLRWAFDTAGVHRVGINVFEYNDGARRLYEKLGFKQEGVVREHWWHEGRWWDDVQFGMLESEWRDLQKR